MRIVFMGSQTIGYRCLQKLIQLGASVTGVVTFVPEKHELWAHSLDELANAHGIPLFVATGKDYVEFVEDNNPDLIFVVGWRQLIPKRILNLPPCGVIGFHASLLPKYRGFAPLNWAMINNEPFTGLTAFYLDEGIDTGDLILQKKVSIDDGTYISDLKETIDATAIQLVEEVYASISKNTIRRKKQEGTASYGCLRTPEDGRINWEQPAEKINSLIHALAPPYPGAFTTYRGKKITIVESSVVEDKRHVFGKLGQIAFRDGETVSIVTGHGLLEIKKAMFEGGQPKSASQCFDSIRYRLGDLW